MNLHCYAKYKGDVSFWFKINEAKLKYLKHLCLYKLFTILALNYSIFLSNNGLYLIDHGHFGRVIPSNETSPTIDEQCINQIQVLHFWLLNGQQCNDIFRPMANLKTKNKPDSQFQSMNM